MIIYFLRHASAGESLDDPKKDEARGLDKEGIRQCTYIGKALAALNVTVDMIATSPLKRALQTASLVGNEIGFEGKMHKEDALRPEGTFNQFAEMMEKYRNHEAIMIVGHNPSESTFFARTISPSGKARIDFKKGSIAKVVAESQGAQLHWMLTPKVARTLYEVSAESARPKTKRK
ncbi:MAG: phosphohistidine phosphatase SixA [Terriglobales bacterium]|jgi:phosphohistidine phosphatase